MRLQAPWATGLAVELIGRLGLVASRAKALHYRHLCRLVPCGLQACSRGLTTAALLALEGRTFHTPSARILVGTDGCSRYET